jgi:dienelactone hydrolase
VIRALRLVCALAAPLAVEETLVAGRPALVAQPHGSGPAIVFLNCATRKGLELPAVRRFLGALARTGFRALAPELPGLAVGELTLATLDAAVATVAEVADPDRVALFGASTGAGLAVVAAHDPRLAGKVNVVAAVAPFADLREVLRRATTADVPELLAEAVPRSLRTLTSDASVEPLLANHDPRRFDQLYCALPAHVRETVEALSPIVAARRPGVQLLIAADPVDPFFPLSEPIALARACASAELTVTKALAHVRPRLRPGLLRLLAYIDRWLTLAAAPAPRPPLQAVPA